jgi:dTMP kinase
MFIVVEGPDGVGKTTQVALLEEFYRKEGYITEVVRDPGSTKLGEQIRTMVKENRPAHKLTNLLLFMASRNELIEKIKGLLALNRVVISDRWFLSTFAYQICGDEIDEDIFWRIFRPMGERLMPTQAYYLDFTQEALERKRAARGIQNDAIEDREKEFQLRVLLGYKQCLDVFRRYFPMEIVPGNLSIEDTQAVIQTHIKGRNLFPV